LDIFTGDRVYGLDEISILTVVEAPGIVAQLGTWQVRQMASGEQGTVITVRD
jgi:hypothetical protein